MADPQREGPAVQNACFQASWRILCVSQGPFRARQLLRAAPVSIRSGLNVVFPYGTALLVVFHTRIVCHTRPAVAESGRVTSASGRAVQPARCEPSRGPMDCPATLGDDVMICWRSAAVREDLVLRYSTTMGASAGTSFARKCFQLTRRRMATAIARVPTSARLKTSKDCPLLLCCVVRGVSMRYSHYPVWTSAILRSTSRRSNDQWHQSVTASVCAPCVVPWCC